MDPGNSFPWSQQPTICIYPQPDQTRQRPPFHPTSLTSILILSSQLRLHFQSCFLSSSLLHHNPHTNIPSSSLARQPLVGPGLLNTFTAIVDLSRFNNSCLKSPASTLVDLNFNRARSAPSAEISYVTCHYRRETYTAASVYLADIIFIPFIVQYAYIAI